ncbi:MAG TPA: Ig-like domain-containing protein, partial [Longimicrobiales bacterium]
GAVNVTLTITSAPPPPPASVASVRIVPHSATLPVGAQQQLSGTALSATGTPLSTPITWTSLDPTVVSVTQAGNVTGVAVGSGRVVASAGGHADTATVTVTASSPVVSVRITPRSVTIPLGGQQTLGATALDATGNPLPYTPTWTSLDPAIVTVTQAGVVTGITPGTGRVLAIVLGVADTATVTVTASPVTVAAVQISPRTATIAVGGQQQLAATALDAAGNVLPVPITWVSLDPGIVSVSPTGLLTGIAVGSGRISASAGGKADTVTVTVTTSAPVASLKITPHSAAIQVGGQQQFTATVLDAAGNPLPYTATWTSLDPALLSVTQTGLVTGLATGKARVVATVQGMADTALVTIDGHLGRTSTTPLTVGELSLRTMGGHGIEISLAAERTRASGLGSDARTLCRGPIARRLPASGSESRRLAAGPVTDQTEPWPTRRRARGAAGQGAAWTVS